MAANNHQLQPQPIGEMNLTDVVEGLEKAINNSESELALQLLDKVKDAMQVALPKSNLKIKTYGSTSGYRQCKHICMTF